MAHRHWNYRGVRTTGLGTIITPAKNTNLPSQTGLVTQNSVPSSLFRVLSLTNLGISHFPGQHCEMFSISISGFIRCKSKHNVHPCSTSITTVSLSAWTAALSFHFNVMPMTSQHLFSLTLQTQKETRQKCFSRASPSYETAFTIAVGLLLSWSLCWVSKKAQPIYNIKEQIVFERQPCSRMGNGKPGTQFSNAVYHVPTTSPHKSWQAENLPSKCFLLSSSLNSHGLSRDNTDYPHRLYLWDL